jgi:hypothetical protein
MAADSSIPPPPRTRPCASKPTARTSSTSAPNPPAPAMNPSRKKKNSAASSPSSTASPANCDSDFHRHQQGRRRPRRLRPRRRHPERRRRPLPPRHGRLRPRRRFPRHPHARRRPHPPRRRRHPSETIAAWFAARIAELGLARERIVLDPGIGFGTTRPQDAAILENLAPLAALGYPLLIGLSRKRIVRTLHPDADRDLASAQMALQAWRNGASILRPPYGSLAPPNPAEWQWPAPFPRPAPG